MSGINDKLNGANRLEFDLGFRDNNNYDIWQLTGLYQWVWNVDGGFNWYAGFGAGIGNVDIKIIDTDEDGFLSEKEINNAPKPERKERPRN